MAWIDGVRAVREVVTWVSLGRRRREIRGWGMMLTEGGGCKVAREGKGKGEGSASAAIPSPSVPSIVGLILVVFLSSLVRLALHTFCLLIDNISQPTATSRAW